MDHLPEPAIELWHKVVPLGLIFFCASFNLTILQVGGLSGWVEGGGHVPGVVQQPQPQVQQPQPQ
jgi:hypothetical protein